MSAAVIDFPRQNLRRPRPVLTVVTPHREDDRAELVSALLLEIERQPLTPILCYPARDIAGTGQVQVTVGQIVFGLTPADCRYAADALIHERGGEPGVLQAVGSLREAGAFAEARPPYGGPLAGVPSNRWRTGMASTVFLLGMIAIGTAVGLANVVIG